MTNKRQLNEFIRRYLDEIRECPYDFDKITVSDTNTHKVKKISSIQ